MKFGTNVLGIRNPSFDPDALRWFAAMPTQPSGQVKTILNAFVFGLKADGLWSLIDGGNFLCLETLEQGLVDFKSPSRVATLAPGFTSTFTSYRGVTGSGSLAASQDAYIDTGFIPSSANGAMTQDSMHLGVMIGSNVAGFRTDIGAVVGTKNAQLVPRSGGNAIIGVMNGAESDTLGSSITTSVGHTVVTRIASNSNKGYKNGVDTGVSTATASIGLPTVPLRYIQSQSSNASTRQIQAGHYGAGLNATQAANLNTRVQMAIAALTVL